MKNLKIIIKTIAIFTIGLFLFASCSSDDNGIREEEPNDPTIEPIVLDCSIMTEPTVLENRGAEIDYIWPCYVKIEAPLTIEAGVTIAFEQGGGMVINDYGSRTGSITAIGTESQPITFTGVDGAPGSWNDIDVGSTNMNNKFHHVIIEYAGGSDGSKPALSANYVSKIELQHSIIRNNKGDGVYVHPQANIDGWKENVITESDGYPLYIAARKIKFLDGTQSTYTNNGTNEIYVNSGSIDNRGFIEDEVNGPKHTWLNPGIPFFIDENIYVRKDRENEKPGHLQIKEGSEFIFGEGYGIQVYHNSPVLEILGTTENPVKFSGQYGAGSWKGINIKESNSNLNKIENTTIADAGESVWNWFNKTGGLSLGTQTGKTISLTMNNVHISNSAGCGIVERRVNSGSNISYNNVTFSDNIGEDICDDE